MNRSDILHKNLSDYLGKEILVEHVRSDGMPITHHGRVRAVKMYLHLEISIGMEYKIPVKSIKSIAEVKE